jgi:hypothetical protein
LPCPREQHPISVGQVSLAIILIHILPFGAIVLAIQEPMRGTNFLCTLIPSGFSRDAPEDATSPTRSLQAAPA